MVTHKKKKVTAKKLYYCDSKKFGQANPCRLIRFSKNGSAAYVLNNNKKMSVTKKLKESIRTRSIISGR